MQIGAIKVPYTSWRFLLLFLQLEQMKRGAIEAEVEDQEKGSVY